MSSIIKKKNRLDNPFLRFAPPGHFYSPIPSWENIRRNENRIWSDMPLSIPGINLNLEEQLLYIDRFRSFDEDLPFKDKKHGALRYYYENKFFPKGDGQTLYYMIRYLSPKRIIEIGSGFSSAVMLDTNELFFNNAIDLTLIEPYPDRLMALLNKGDITSIQLVSEELQEVELAMFHELEANDILFIDSTHVSKIGSDVNYLLFHILPHLNRGVHIHFHDIFYPFEYPKEWLYEGRAWNEIYLLRGFLQYNNQFKITWFHHYLMSIHYQSICDALPDIGGGGSFWIKKL
jgi:predicted O-methyltransferase YrrM